MQYVRLGASGLRVSRICLGMMSYGDPSWRPWVLDEAAAYPIVQHAVELGVTFFDTANVYSQGVSEQVTGGLLRKLFTRREEYVLATKVCSSMGPGPNDRGLSRKHVLASIDASLRRLGTDYVDLYQVHRWDYETPVEETLDALNDVVHAGKARYIGASSMYAWQFAKVQYTAQRNGWTRFVSMQNHYNLIYREEEREMMPLCRDLGVGVIPWSPLARGWLTGSRHPDAMEVTQRARTDEFARQLYDVSDFAVIDDVAALAAHRGLLMAQIALAWLLHQPGVTAPIIGATAIRHIDDAVTALNIALTEDERRQLESHYQPHHIHGHS